MNKTLFIAAAGTAILAGLAACTSTKSVPATVSDLTGEWSIIKVEGKDITVPQNQDAPYIAFDTKNGQISGSASCNRIMGAFDTKAEPGVIDFSRMASTRICLLYTSPSPRD